MKNNKNKFFNKFAELTVHFEKVITLVLACVIAMIIIISLYRVVVEFYDLLLQEINNPELITFANYQLLFGQIITLIISVEFMVSIVKVLKLLEIKTIVQDILLITALGIARKLLIFDYEHFDNQTILTYGGLLVAIGVLYFFIRAPK